jgi:hypothetical protein
MLRAPTLCQESGHVDPGIVQIPPLLHFVLFSGLMKTSVAKHLPSDIPYENQSFLVLNPTYFGNAPHSGCGFS